MKSLRAKISLLPIILAFPFVLNGQADSIVARIISTGTADNRVMEHMDFLSNRFGDRLTGSDSYYSACVWAVKTMRSWGMMAEMQEAGELPVGFNRGPWSGRMLSPRELMLDFGTPAYTAGTKGKQKGPVRLMPASAEEFWKVRDSIKGAWILIEGENTGWPRDRKGESPLVRLVREAGALGTIQSSKFPVRVLYQKVVSWDSLPVLPDIKLIDKQYNEIKELVGKGEKVELEFDIRNYFRPGPVKYHNVIGWIPGSKYPDEYVVMGGHLDGLAGGTASIDNASGAAPAMEAARLILAAGGRPERTILVQLWAAEEFGLLGSTAWVDQNPDKLPRISAVFNRDGGTNCISGISVPKEMLADFQLVTRPLAGLNTKFPFELTERKSPLRKGGRGHTDTFPFLQEGIPAFGFNTKGEHQYGNTWHSTLDLYNEAIPEYQEYSSVATAVVVWGVANLDHLLSRKNFFMSDGIYADFNTNKGRIMVRLDFKKAPMTVANFIGLAEGTISNASYPEGIPFFTNSIWHRVVKGHVIQGGEPSIIKDPASTEVNSVGYEIPNEISDLSHNRAGMLGMANAGPHTNTCEYYITLADRSYLDGNYTLFGEVVDGMDVVNRIEQGDTTKSIVIVRAGREAMNFKVNDEIFLRLVENQWKKVKTAEQNRKLSSEKFVADNYPGLTDMGNGLRYKILEPGKGTIPPEGSELRVSYSGRLVNGTRFVSGEDGKPESGDKPSVFDFKKCSESVVKGIQESLRTMKAGEKRLVVIPPDLAYGAAASYYGKMTGEGKRLVISPGEILIVEVMLNKINITVR
jgi:cyclophilin family peptidyl-prolyl cis-trans isomerase